MEPKRILGLILAAAVLLLSTVGCKGSENANGGVPLGSAESVRYKDESGQPLYRIVRPDGNTEMTALAAKIYKGFKDIGIVMTSVADFEEDNGEYEILIGATNRSESAEALKRLKEAGYGRYKDGIICSVGKKIVINGHTEEGIAEAVDFFLENYIKESGIDGGIDFMKSTDGNFTEIKVNGIGIEKFNFVLENMSRSRFVKEGTDKLLDSIKEKTGYICSCSTEKSGEYNIIIGEETDLGLGYDGYEISVDNNEVHIFGGSTYALQAAVEKFAKMLLSGDVTVGDSEKGSYNADLSEKDYGYYKLVWSDEFDGNELNTDKWVCRVDRSKMGGAADLKVLDTQDTVFLADGKLNLRAIAYSDPSDERVKYAVPASVHTQGTMEYRYGYVEMCAKVPFAVGTWPSFWAQSAALLGERKCTDYMVEVDIFEVFGSTDTAVPNIHKWYSSNYDYNALHGENVGSNHTQASQKNVYKFSDKEELREGFHVYGFDWTPTEMSMYIDGVLYQTFDTVNSYDRCEDMTGFSDPLYLIFNNHLFTPESSFSPNLITGNEEVLPSVYEIDWVRMYQSKSVDDTQLWTK